MSLLLLKELIIIFLLAGLSPSGSAIMGVQTSSSSFEVSVNNRFRRVVSFVLCCGDIFESSVCLSSRFVFETGVGIFEKHLGVLD